MGCRYNRPSWATGLFIALGAIVAGAAGIMMHREGKKVKKVEGVPPKDIELSHDIESGEKRNGSVTKGPDATTEGR